MTFLPIVNRELRVIARRRSLYRARLAVALTAMLLAGIILLVNLGAPQHQLGRHVFEGLSVLAIIYCLFSGRISTADCLSEEKREGTLGLLFLTDLKGYDVVLGKLAATSLSAFYGLLAMLPVLAVPLLLGGITNAEFWRVALVLVNTFLLSLAIGIFGSALSRDARRAMAANLALGLLLMAVLPASTAAVIYFAGLPVGPESFMSCPLYSFYLCDDARYKAAPHQFWWSVAVIHCLTWLLVALTGWIVPRTWQDKAASGVRKAKTDWRDLWHAWSYGRDAKRGVFRKQLLDVNAFYWLAGRARLKPVHVWTFLGLMAGWWIWSWQGSGTVWFEPLTASVLALILNSTLKLWIALEAGQQLSEDQRAGALELLLSTPLTVRDILHGQLLALRRQFLGPLLLVAAIQVIFMTGQWSASAGDPRAVATSMAVVLLLLADAWALTFVAMRVALTARSTHRAVLATISRILVLPWVAFGLGVGIAALWAELFSTTGWSPGWKFYLGLYFSVGMLTDLIFGLIAVRQLLNNFRQLATQRFAPARFARSLSRRTTAVLESAVGGSPTHHMPADRTSRPIWTRKRALMFGTALGVVVAGVLCFFASSKSNFPPAVVVSMTHSNGPLRVFPGIFMVLPDGSLWRWGGSGWPEFPKAVVPEPIGTNSDWVLAAAGNRCVGIRRDGTLWEWGDIRTWGAPGTGQFVKDPEPVGPGHDWISASSGGRFSMALKRDGTLWAWGDNSATQLGNGSGPGATHPVQVGTNQDWAAVTCQGASTLGLRTDGTLWVWGRIFTSKNRTFTANTFPTPTRFCRETNWAGLSADSQWAWTQSGEVWSLTGASPDPEATVAVTSQLIATNFVPGHLISAFPGAPKLYQIRADGTLWEKSYSFGPWTAPPADPWQRVGKRSDWVELWSVWGTAMGRTADGTVWTWGIDQSRFPTHNFSTKLKLLQSRLKGFFGSPPALGAGMAASMPYQKEPRPLMRLMME